MENSNDNENKDNIIYLMREPRFKIYRVILPPPPPPTPMERLSRTEQDINELRYSMAELITEQRRLTDYFWAMLNKFKKKMQSSDT